MPSTPVALAVAIVFALAAYILRLFTRSYFSPARDIPGPPNPSWLWGNFKDIVFGENWALHQQWFDTYGPVVRYTGLFNGNTVVTRDSRAIHHVLSDPAYEKPPQAQRDLAAIVGGKGLLLVEGHEHRKQNPAFGPTQIREMTDIFVEKSLQLRDIWMSEIAKSSSASNSEKATVDAVSWLSKLTLDVIGLAGFNYHFDALNPAGTTNELNDAFSIIFQTATAFTFFNFAKGYFPILQYLPTERNRKSAQGQAAMNRIGRQLLAEKKAAVLADLRGEKQKVGRDSVQGRDLLSLLVRANMATDLPEGQRMSDEDVLAQVPTFLAAGHETTSTSTTWALYALALAPEVQSKLRAEVLGVSTDMPSMDELMALPYLDAVCRETLRVHAPVPASVRIATRDDVIPTDSKWVDRNGVERQEIRVAKGDIVFIPILVLNRAQAIWGDDAEEFRPERWEKIPEAASKVPGIWGNLMTFLGGQHACIGYRFSIVEMKAILFTLVRAFELELGVPADKIVKRSMIVTRPVDLSEGEGKNRLPLIIRPLRQ
ncbi:cytochrome P450 [Gloeophyllum trabeum ATCC 11539]|uniref:Cytochrome P450 n=1 Tax=Gloeophyllum trabeum (strain ATCC 11539 / FP-39264 / Madison 617) TaxID=670483 RepID=S7PR64_GLOTA|nr:cytochrome P450 [Gloeophyllum trabeum ATCC 11539]EPQ50326.1 cytochrome P450 [Gloeophyllum trabeum ATCC 11539]